ncbi:unnamed protein product [marine sediment metagenome]|uniref:Uncharacterized protein n=1 Tax=marine sediment metagenome TaxID=412755 RepID=X0Y056_9ZZZZ
MEFKVGNKVKLESYKRYNDYREHRNQVATITNIDYTSYAGDDLVIQIVWADKTTSAVTKNNIMPDKVTNWKQRIENGT